MPTMMQSEASQEAIQQQQQQQQQFMGTQQQQQQQQDRQELAAAWSSMEQQQPVPIQLHQNFSQRRRDAQEKQSFFQSSSGLGLRPFQQQQQQQQHPQQEQQSQQQQQQPQIPEHERTTLMLRNIPNDYNFYMLKELVDSFGFRGQYDFLYLPVDFRKGANIGYAFVNAVNPATARQIREAFDGFEDWAVQSGKTCEVSWSFPQQGLAEHVERYRNSPVMHESTPRDYKPRIYHNGYEVQFPPPTKHIKPVKLRPMRQVESPRY